MAALWRSLAIGLCFCFVPILGLLSAAREAHADRSRRPSAGQPVLSRDLARLHTGGYDNVLMPAYAGVAIYFGVGFGLAMKEFAPGSRARLALFLAVALQFVGLFYWPQAQVPSAANRRQGEAILQRIGDFQGQVFWAGHPWYLHMLGKPTQAQDVAITDILRALEANEWKQRLADEMQAAVATGKYEAFVVDFTAFTLRPPDFDKYYELAESNFANGGVFCMMTGWDRTPTYLYVRRSDAQKTPQ